MSVEPSLFSCTAVASYQFLFAPRMEKTLVSGLPVLGITDVSKSGLSSPMGLTLLTKLSLRDMFIVE